MEAFDFEIEALLKVASKLLTKGDWDGVYEYCANALEIDDSSAMAYYYMLMADNKIKYDEDFDKACLAEGISANINYKRAHRFADEKMRMRLDELKNLVVYNEGSKIIREARNHHDYRKAGVIFDFLGDYKDSAKMAVLCREKVMTTAYESAVDCLENAQSVEDFDKSKNIFMNLNDYKDSQEKVLECERSKEFFILEVRRAKRHKIMKIMATISFAMILLVMVYLGVNRPIMYQRANAAFEAKDYEKAYSLYHRLGKYKDCEMKSISVNISRIKEAELYDVVRFGDNKWYMINKEDNRYTLLSENAVALKKYNDSEGTITWANSDIRQWLNGEYIESNFNETQKKFLVKEKLSSVTNSHTNKNEDTEDYVYLISIEDARRIGKELRKTHFNGIENDWWLRNVNDNGIYCSASFVFSNRQICEVGLGVSELAKGIRPAITLQID